MSVDRLRSFLSNGVMISLVVAVVLALIYFIFFKVMPSIKPNPELAAWFNTPVSQLRVTHIFFLIWFAGFIFRK